jgi:hypothetical protein
VLKLWIEPNTGNKVGCIGFIKTLERIGETLKNFQVYKQIKPILARF